jgi:ATP-dependent Clp protease ATP-binding subunit ClpC
MIERMAERGAQRLYLREAERLGHNHIGCEHLLLGMLADEGGLAAKVLTAHGVALDAARRRTAEICGDCRQNVARWTHSPRATVVHRLAEVEAERLDQLRPEDAHLLLAMITEGGGIPNKLFAELGVDVARMREDLPDALEVSDDARRTYLRQRRAAERAGRQRASEQRQRDA